MLGEKNREIHREKKRRISPQTSSSDFSIFFHSSFHIFFPDPIPPYANHGYPFMCFACKTGWYECPIIESSNAMPESWQFV